MKKLKRTLLCLAAAAMLATSGTALADSIPEADPAETEENSAFESGHRETEEFVKASYEAVTSFLRKMGETDGYTVYVRDKDFEEKLWDRVGGKPAKKSDYTDEQKALAEDISDLKSSGELIAVDDEKKTAIAGFSGGKKSGEEKLYASNAGRFLLYTNSDGTRPLRIRELVSSIDNPYLFRSADGKTLERMNSDLSKVLTEYTLGRAQDDSDQGKLVYRSGDAFAWLSEDGSQVIGTYRKCAENDELILLVDDRLGNFGLKRKSDGYIWWSSPMGASRDPNATPLISDELRSSTVLRYGIPERRSNNNILRSGTSDCTIAVSDIRDGVRVNYKFTKAGFEYPVEYTLEGDHLKASLKVSQIKETVSGNIATELTLMGSFGAGSDTEEGYFVIPDGSGALVRFNNGRTMVTNAYSRRVYGNDVTAVPTSKGASAEQLCFPVYGIVKDGGALLAVAAKGDSNADLSVRISKQSNSSYNMCGFTFVLRGTDTFYLSGNVGDKLTVFESGAIGSDDIEMLYFPIDGGYTDIAARYRQYLADTGVKAKSGTDDDPLYIGVYGGVMKKKPVLGVPVTMKQDVTDFSEAADIISDLRYRGVDSIVLTYDNWTDKSIAGRVDKTASPAPILGGRSGFEKLRQLAADNSTTIYPVYDCCAYTSGGGYSSFSGSSVRISGAYSRIVSYDRAYGIPDGFRKNRSLLSPDRFGEVYSGIGAGCEKSGIEGVSVGTMASQLYGDYGKKHLTRADSQKITAESLAALADTLDDGILAENPNAYALPYVSRITNVPLSSSRFDIFDEDIPFAQLVLHGFIPYSTQPVNGAADTDKLLLMATVTGSPLCYDLAAAEANVLKDTEYDIYYYAGAESNSERIAAEYSLLQPVISSTAGAAITSCDISADGNIITTGFSNGVTVSVDMEAKTVQSGGKTISLADLRKGGSNG